jgi:serine/threonine-protein kinase
MIVNLASSVADGADVDWTRVEDLVPAPQRRLVRHLKLVDSIATLHRSVPAEDAQDPAASTQREPGRRQWGRLVLIERIGQGMSGDVHRAHDTELHREVALKLLHDGPTSHDAHRRVLEEARRLARIRHPHVVHVYGAEQHEGRVGLWMELVKGESLEQIVRTRGHFGAQEAAMIGLDLCSALAAVHGAGLLHRDVKAQNVLREAGGRIVLMDFGTGEELKAETGSNRMVGTPLYLAPELFKGKPATPQTDIYSLGVLLFHLVTGEFPVKAASMVELGKAHSQGVRRRLRDARPDLPTEFVAAVERSLDPDPLKRFASAGEMESALRPVLDLRPPVQPAPVVGRPRIGSRVALGTVAAALLLAIVGLIVWGRLPAGNDAATVAGTRIAVLPFTDLSGSTTAPYLAEALTDELISTLGQVGALQVSSLTSTSRFREDRPDLQAIGRELGVGHLLEGTVLSEAKPGEAPPSVRVNVRLLAAGTGVTLWTNTFERQLGDTFAIQTDIARAVARAVNATLTPGENARLVRKRQTKPAAEEAYLQGRVHMAGYGVDATRRALEAFQRAISIDPAHAAAHAGAARAYFTLGYRGGMSQPDARAASLAAARRALDLDDTLADAHAALADVRFYSDWDWVGAEQEFGRAIELNPSFTYSRLQYAQMLAAVRRLDEAVRQARLAVDLDPLSADALRVLAVTLYYARDYAGADEAVGRSLVIEKSSAGALAIQGRIAEAQGRADDALSLTENALQLSDVPPVLLRVQHMRLLALNGKAAQARAALKGLEQELSARQIESNPHYAAFVRLALGDRDAALDGLESAVRLRQPTVMWLAVDPRVDDLRADPRFTQMLRRLGIP